MPTSDGSIVACEAQSPTMGEAPRAPRGLARRKSRPASRRTPSNAAYWPGRTQSWGKGPAARATARGAKQSQWPATTTRKTRLAEGRSRQTNPIGAVHGPAARTDGVKQSQLHRPATPRTLPPGNGGRLRQTKPIRSMLDQCLFEGSRVRADRACAKQSQLAEPTGCSANRWRQTKPIGRRHE